MAEQTTQNGNGQRRLLDVRGLVKYFPIKRGFFRRTVGTVKAVDNISFDIMAGETLSLVGEAAVARARPRGLSFGPMNPLLAKSSSTLETVSLSTWRSSR